MAYQTISPLFMESLYLSPFHDVGRREIMGLLLYGTKVHIGVHYILQTVVVIVHRESFWVIWILSPLWCWQPPNSCFTKFDNLRNNIICEASKFCFSLKLDFINSRNWQRPQTAPETLERRLSLALCVLQTYFRISL